MGHITAKEQVKLTDAGLTLLYVRLEPTSNLAQRTYSIWKKTKEKRDWHLHEKGLMTKASVKRAIGKLKQDRMMIDLFDAYNSL
jgi:hypothetical protein